MSYTFKHLSYNIFLPAMDISRLPRSAVGYSAFGRVMKAKFTKNMVQIQLSLVQLLYDKQKTIFCTDSNYDLRKLIENWCKNHKNISFEKIRRKYQAQYEMSFYVLNILYKM